MAAKSKLRKIAADLDPLKLLEEMRAVQAYLAALVDGETPPQTMFQPPNLAAFVASLSSAWPRAKSVQPSPSKPNRVTCEIYKRSRHKPLLRVPAGAQTGDPNHSCCSDSANMQEKPKPVYAEPGQALIQALHMVWPIVCRRLEEYPNINATQLFEDLCVRFPGRLTRKQYKTLVRRVNSDGSISGARRLAHAALSLGPRRIVGSTTNRVVDVPISLRPIEMKWH